MWELLKSYPVKQRSEIIEQLIQNPDFEDFSVITNFICTIEKAFGRIFDDIDSTNQIITETELEQIEKLWYQKIESLKSTTDLIHCSYFLDLFLLWEKINKSTLTIYLKESINKNPINLPPFLMINHRVSIGRVRLKYFVEEDFSDYFTAEEIFSLSDSLIHSSDYQSLDSSEQNIVMAYYLWYQQKDTENYKIIDEEIEKQIQNLSSAPLPKATPRQISQ